MPTGTISGAIRLVSTIAMRFATGAGVISPYTIAATPDDTATYGAGTGPNQANRLATPSGTTTISTLVTIDLSTIVCVDQAVGFGHLRELIVYNDDTANVLRYDPTVTNSFLGPLVTAAKIDVPPGSVLRFSRPLGTNGWVVDGTHKVLTLDPGAFAVPYRVMLLGD